VPVVVVGVKLDEEKGADVEEMAVADVEDEELLDEELLDEELLDEEVVATLWAL
jgi:hypothetical protein